MARDLETREITRKLWHLSFIWAPIAFYFWIEQTPAVLIGVGFFFLFVILDVLRIWVLPRGNEIAFRYFSFLLRDKERNQFSTAVYFSLACVVCGFFFTKEVAVLAVTFLCIGDPIAAFVGAKYGTIRILNKSLEGSSACFVACFVAALVIGFSFKIAILAALTATLFELISSRINDNLSIPIFSGLTVTWLQETPLTSPLQIALVIFKVYLIFVILTSIAGVFLKHYVIAYYRARYDETFERTDYRPTVSIIKPVKGAEPWAYANFATFCRQDYPGTYEVIFSMEDEHDPAFRLVENLRREFPKVKIRTVLAGTSTNTTSKMNNLLHAEREAAGEVLVFSDSPVHVSQDYLRTVIAPLGDARIGIVTGAAAYYGARNIPAALNTLLINLMGSLLYFPLAFFGKLESANGCTVAIRKAVLDEVGGLRKIADQISDVHALAQMVYEKGYKIHLAKQMILVRHERITWMEWLKKTHRMNVTFRTYVPNLYPLFLFQSGLFHAAIFCLLTHGSMLAWYLIAATLLLKTASHLRFNYKLIGDRSTYYFIWLLPFLLLIAPFFWTSPYFSKVVHWRTQRYFVDQGGMATRLRDQAG